MTAQTGSTCISDGATGKNKITLLNLVLTDVFITYTGFDIVCKKSCNYLW